jgi:hypothetical protein
VHGAAASHPKDDKKLRFSTPAAAGDTLEAFQAFTPAGGAIIQGPTVPSLPLQTTTFREPPAPTVRACPMSAPALPPNWSNHPQLTSNPGKLFITASQTNCDKGSDTAKQPVEPLPGLVGQPGMTKPVECARVIAANTLTPGAVVVVHSDLADSAVLSGPVFVTASNMLIGVYRPLRANEHVHLKQSGCDAASDSVLVQVDPFPGVGAPVIAGPVRIPHGGINLERLIVGARVSIFVNGVLKASVDAAASAMFAPVPGLTREAVVVARQSMCTKISDESNREIAQFGELRVRHSPSPITRTRPESITVTAIDRETDHPVVGNVRIGSTVVGTTGTAFGFTFPSGAPPASVVNAVDYNPAPITWNLVDPPPAPLTMLRLTIANQAPGFFTITGLPGTSCARS